VTAPQLIWAVCLVVVGYLAGSLSPSVFLGRRLKGVDVREHGSGNAGTTNAFRVLGSKLGLTVLLLDILKGVVPVVLARRFSIPLAVVFVALACVLGHNYSAFLRGRGGKGVATGAGVAIAMMPLPMAALIGVFLVLFIVGRTVSIASIVCAILLPVFAAVFREPLPYIIVSCLLALLVLWGHRTNMVRLRHGSERKVTFPWNAGYVKKSGRTSAPEDSQGTQ
jgi:acyl phosphate:glycerol-3-phosphate acyltransferase